MDATWQRLGDAAGTKGVGVNRVRVEPGKLPTPPHSHGASEELFFILAGSGSRVAGRRGARGSAARLRHPRGRQFEHTFVAGPEGLEYLVFGTRHPTELGWLPRSRAIRIGWPWVEGRDDDPWDVEATVEPLAYGDPAPRPANIVNVDEVEHESWRGRRRRPHRSRRASDEARRAPLGADRRRPPRLRIRTATRRRRRSSSSSRGRRRSSSGNGEARVEETPLRAGHLVARPPGTRISHSFRAGPDGVTMLIYGTREPNDMCWFPRSRKIFLRGLGVIGRIEELDYFDGEPVEDD